MDNSKKDSYISYSLAAMYGKVSASNILNHIKALSICIRRCPTLILFIAINMMICQNLEGQSIRNSGNAAFMSSLEELGRNGFDNWNGLMGRERPISPPEGDPFHYFAFCNASIKLKKESSFEQNLMMMYDVQNDVIYLKFDEDEIRTLNPRLVERFYWMNPDGKREQFARTDLYENTNFRPAGFYQILNDEAIQLLSRRFVRVKKADYREGIGTGRQFDQLLKSDLYYLNVDGKTYEFSGKPKKDQEILSKIGIEDVNLKSFEKQHRTKIKTKEGMLLLSKSLSQNSEN